MRQYGPVLLCLLVAPLFAAEPVSFNRDIRPIMADTCFRCHGPDKNSRMANLRLDVREEALKPTKSGAIPIVPGDPDKSDIVARVFSTNPAKLMPPKFAHKDLNAAQKDTIRRWVKEGAAYEGHWAYQPVKRPPVPAVANDTLVRNPVDAFVQERLAKAGLTPSAEADRRTLLRRVALDLTGIPPTPQEVAAFVADAAPDAYEKVVAKLLDSTRYAEKQAMYWLDAVRYGDTCGFHGDNAFPAWPYRDWVLNSFRSNKPFDEFTREQLAGDLLPNPTEQTRVASAFNRLTRTSAEGGLQPKEYLAKYAADRVRTTSSVWLGSTMGCAECHDHKFDPIATRDFYSMKAFFADIKETGLVPDQGAKAWGELLMLPSPPQKRQWTEVEERLAEAKKALVARRQSLTPPVREAHEKSLLSSFKAGDLDWAAQRPVKAVSRNGAELKIYLDEPVTGVFDRAGSIVSETGPGNGIIIAGGRNPDKDTFSVTVEPGAGTWQSLGLEVISDDRLPGARLARGSDRLVVTEVGAALSTAPAVKLKFTRARSNLTFWDAGLTPWAAIDGDSNTGWGAATYRTFRTAFLALDFEKPVTTAKGQQMIVTISNDSAYRRAAPGRFRVALARSNSAQPVADRSINPRVPGLSEDQVKALETAADKRTEQQRDDVDALVDSTHVELQALWQQVARLESERTLLRHQIPSVVVSMAGDPEPVRILPRGNFLDDSGDIVEPAIPAFFGKLDTAGRRATRLDLADWLVSPENPLTARAFVNRTWRQLFGTGLSKVLEDLGSQGEWPTHPELIDWLAAEFMAPSWQPSGTHPWDMRHIVRVIVLSHTYRQASTASRQTIERDPDNRLLARQSRFRVDAEIVRDIALHSAGLLKEKFGGPSVKPYQPEGYLAALNFPKRDYSESPGDEQYRRGLYNFWQRTFLHPSLAAFDAPTREECTVNRVSSNTPLQALVLLNDPIFVEAARVLAQRMVAEGGGSIESRVAYAFRRAVGREPSTEETALLAELYKKDLARFRKAPADARALLRVGEAPTPGKSANPADTAATFSVARAILNLHEVITRN